MTRTRNALAILAIVSVLADPSSHASVIAVPNGDFSIGSAPNNNFSTSYNGPATYTFASSPSVWSNWTATVSTFLNYFGNDAPHGDFVNRDIKLYYSNTIAGTATVSQTLGTLVAPNTIYTLTADLTRWGDRPTPTTLDLRLLVGGVELTGGVLTSPTLQDSESPNAVNFVTWTKKYTTGGSVTAGALQIQLFTADTGAPALGDLVFFDNVTLDGTLIPEPSTLLLLLAGGGLVVRRRLP